jgi:hypothetical protein
MVRRFGLWGADLYGAACWEVSTFDSRVKAMVPVGAIPSLGMFVRAPLVPSAPEGERQTSGGDTRGRGLLHNLHQPEIERLLAIVNPLNFMDYMTMPKLMIMGTNSEVLPPDSMISIATWWSWMPKPKSLLFIEAGHADVMKASASQVASYISGLLIDEPMPDIDYTFDSVSHRLLVKDASNHTPVSVSWHSSVSCDPYMLFSASEWSGRQRQVNVSTQSWEEVLVQPGDVLPIQANSTSPCAYGGFLRLSYSWPAGAIDRFNISTPVVMQFDVPVHRVAGGLRQHLGRFLGVAICISVALIGFCYYRSRSTFK